MEKLSKQELEERAKGFVEGAKSRMSTRLYGMMQPRYVDCDPDNMSMTIAFPAQDWELNPTGAIHGGITVAMLDSVMGSATHVFTGHLTPTIHIDVSFLRAGPADDEIFVRAKVEKIGRSIIYVSGETWASSAPDKLIATAIATFKNHEE